MVAGVRVNYSRWTDPVDALSGINRYLYREQPCSDLRAPMGWWRDRPENSVPLRDGDVPWRRRSGAGGRGSRLALIDIFSVLAFILMSIFLRG